MNTSSYTQFPPAPPCMNVSFTVNVPMLMPAGDLKRRGSDCAIETCEMQAEEEEPRKKNRTGHAESHPVHIHCGCGWAGCGYLRMVHRAPSGL
jgi:hypothetical protein